MNVYILNGEQQKLYSSLFAEAQCIAMNDETQLNDLTTFIYKRLGSLYIRLIHFGHSSKAGRSNRREKYLHAHIAGNAGAIY